MTKDFWIRTSSLWIFGQSEHLSWPFSNTARNENNSRGGIYWKPFILPRGIWVPSLTNESFFFLLFFLHPPSTNLSCSNGSPAGCGGDWYVLEINHGLACRQSLFLILSGASPDLFVPDEFRGESASSGASWSKKAPMAIAA